MNNMLRKEAVEIIRAMTEKNIADRDIAVAIFGEPKTAQAKWRNIYKVRHLRRVNGIAKSQAVPVLRKNGIINWLLTKEI